MDLIRAGVSAELVAKVADAIAAARAEGAEAAFVAAMERGDAAIEARRTNERERTSLYLEHRGISEVEWLGLCGTVYRRDGMVCAYCQGEEGPFAIDHIIPLSRGGTNELHNLTVACRSCNSSKGGSLLSEWWRYRDR